MTTFLADRSNHDWPALDLAAEVRDGVTAVCHKLTDGPRFYADPYFAAAANQMRAARVPLPGAYHVLWNRDPVGQMRWFLDRLFTLAPWMRDLPACWLMLDCEPFRYNGGAPGPEAIHQAADYLYAQTGWTPTVYAPKWAYGSTLRGLRYPLVASAYGPNAAGPYRSLYPGDHDARWSPYSAGATPPLMLQYGSRTTVAGRGPRDMCAYPGSPADLLRRLGRTPPHPLVDDLEDDMFAVPPTPIADRVPGARQSHVIPPVNAGGLPWGPAWLSVGGDLFGGKAAFRLAYSGGSGDWTAVQVDAAGQPTTDGTGTDKIVLRSGQLFTLQLPDRVRLLSFVRLAVDDHDDCSGSLSFGIEYGRRSA